MHVRVPAPCSAIDRRAGIKCWCLPESDAITSGVSAGVNRAPSRRAIRRAAEGRTHGGEKEIYYKEVNVKAFDHEIIRRQANDRKAGGEDPGEARWQQSQQGHQGKVEQHKVQQLENERP